MSNKKTSEKRTSDAIQIMDRELSEQLEVWRQAQEVPPTRTQIMRQAIEEFLENHPSSAKLAKQNPPK